MPSLRCPNCGNKGEVQHDEERFAFRGEWPDGHYPVRKCMHCGKGLILKPKFLFFGSQPELVPEQDWARMEAEYADAVRHVTALEDPPV